MVMVPHAGKMHFRHSDQQNSSGGGTQTPRMGFATSVLAGSGSARHGLPPQAKYPSYAPANSWMLAGGCSVFNREELE